MTTDKEWKAFQMSLWLGGFRMGTLEVHVTPQPDGPQWEEVPKDERHRCDEATTEPGSAYINALCQPLPAGAAELGAAGRVHVVVLEGL